MRSFLVLSLSLSLLACGDDDGTVDPDAGSDAGTDAPVDVGTDVGSDAGADAGSDAGADAGPMFARVRTWHLSGSESDETIDLYADADAVISGTAYEASSAWTDLDPATYDFAIHRGGTDFDYQDFGSIELVAGDDYTFISAQVSAPGGTMPWIPIGIPEDVSPPPAGMAKIRFFHGSYAFEGGVALHDMADEDTALVTIAAQGGVAESAIMIAAGTYTFGVDVGDGPDSFGDPDGTVDLVATETIDLADQDVVTLGVFAKPGAALPVIYQLVWPNADGGAHQAVILEDPDAG